MFKIICFSLVLAASAYAQETNSLGIFEGASDIGTVAKKGTVTYDAGKGEYRVTGGGANVWSTNDAFFFVWRKMQGNISLTANVRFEGTGGAPHRMVALTIRKDLDPGSVHVDGVVHGNGLTIIKYRDTANDITRTVRFPVEGPTRIRLERRGPWFTLYTGKEGQPLAEAGSIQAKMAGPVYAGLAVCPHDDKAEVTAVFSDVTVERPATAAAQPKAAN